MGKLRDETGATYGRWTVLVQRTTNRHGQATWLCRCSCSNHTEREVAGCQLRTGMSRSCGCLQREAAAAHASEHNRKHGHNCNAPTPEYYSWVGMRTRCNNPNATGYERYGGRGIEVCERWEFFPNFLADMGERPDGFSLDRIDPDGNYKPSNCRWSDAKTQRHNRSAKVFV